MKKILFVMFLTLLVLSLSSCSSSEQISKEGYIYKVTYSKTHGGNILDSKVGYTYSYKGDVSKITFTGVYTYRVKNNKCGYCFDEEITYGTVTWKENIYKGGAYGYVFEKITIKRISIEKIPTEILDLLKQNKAS